MFVYIGFIIFMLVLGFGVFLYALKQVAGPNNSLTGTAGEEGVRR